MPPEGNPEGFVCVIVYRFSPGRDTIASVLLYFEDETRVSNFIDIHQCSAVETI